MALYTDTVMDHFMHPRNVGEIPDADGVGQVGNAKCGDIMKMYLKIKDGVIEDVKFETFGCGSAIASSSMATEMIKGKTIDEALAVTNRQVVEAVVCRPTSCTVPCWRRSPSSPPSRTTMTATASSTTTVGSRMTAARWSPAAWCKGEIVYRSKVPQLYLTAEGLSVSKSFFDTLQSFFRTSKSSKNDDYYRAGHPFRVSRTHPSAPLTKVSPLFDSQEAFSILRRMCGLFVTPYKPPICGKYCHHPSGGGSVCRGRWKSAGSIQPGWRS